jgi:RNA exonuclease 1
MAVGRAIPGLTGSSDTNFRFSGLVEKDLDTAVMNLDAVRKAVCMFVGPETIIVGHG